MPPIERKTVYKANRESNVEDFEPEVENAGCFERVFSRKDRRW